jgi:hypothetical protein
MLERTRLATNLKYRWQEAVLDALNEDKLERCPAKSRKQKEPFPHG